MGSRYEVEVTVASATDLKNVNWRNGDLHPYAVLWVDDGARCSSRVDLDNGESPVWDEKIALLRRPPRGRRPLHRRRPRQRRRGHQAARRLRDVLDDAGVGGRASRTLRLKRPSGRPQGRLDVRVAVREPARYYDPSHARDVPYGAPAPYSAGGGYGQPHYAAPPSGYPAAYGEGGYGSGAAMAEEPTKKKKEGMGMGAGLAIGAAGGLLGGLAIAGGASYLEDKFDDEVEEKVEEELAARDDFGGGGDDDFGGGGDDDDC